MMQAGDARHPEFPEHFDGKRFYNPGGSQARGFLDVLRWKLTSRPEPSPRFIADVTPCVPPARVETGALRVTLVNHSTVLLQQRGWNILTDPIWSRRASPVSWIGPRRRRDPGVRFEDLPDIQLVLLSHNHYDHLDMPTMRRLAGRGKLNIIAPVAAGGPLRSQNFGEIRELDWGGSLALDGIKVHCVPALHFSGRSLFDLNRTLWCGYVIESRDRRIYFAGDTAFGPHFAQIRERLGAPDVALLPIGAYEPRWFMRSVHMGPEEAVKAHQILGTKASVAIHHGTFKLTDEGIDTPKQRLRDCAGREAFLALNNGECIEIP